jgi:hypothetical protein
MSKELSRRNFLERIGLGTAAGASLSILKDIAAAQPTLVDPLRSRTLGRTGAKVSILAFGLILALLISTRPTHTETARASRASAR